MELLKKLSDSEVRAFTLLEERVVTCEKSLTAAEQHLEEIISKYKTNQSVAEASLLELHEQVADLQKQKSQLEERVAIQETECAATCETSLKSQELHLQTLISEHERNHSISNTRLMQLQEHAVKLQNQINEQERRSLEGLQESRRAIDLESAELRFQAAENLSRMESQWQRRYQNLQNEHVNLQQDLKQQRNKFERLLVQYYATRQDMFATYRALHSLQLQSNAGGKWYIVRIVAFIFDSAMRWAQIWIAVAMERATSLQDRIHEELEVTGVFALVQWLHNQILPAAKYLKKRVTVSLIQATLPHIAFRAETLPGVSRSLHLRRQLHAYLTKLVRVASHLLLAYWHVTRTGQQNSHSSIEFAVSWLQWSHQHSDKVVQRTELSLWLFLALYLVVRLKLMTRLLWRKKNSVQRQRDPESRTTAVAPTKITPAFRRLQQTPNRRFVIQHH
jgi:hypothetical protein